MERKDLENLSTHIINILEVRNDIIYHSFANKDLDSLKDILKNDSERKVPEDAWSNLNFFGMQEKDFEFFLYVKELPGFKNDSTDLINQVIYSAYQNKDLFDLCSGEPELAAKIKEMAPEFGDDRTVSKEVIEELSNRGLITVSKASLNNALTHGKENYIEFFLENNLFEFSNEDYKKAYIYSWNSYNERLMNLIKEQFPSYKEIKLTELIDSITPSSYDGDKTEKIRDFLNLYNDRFITTIKEHSVNENEVLDIINAFSKQSPVDEIKYGAFVSLILSDFPENIDALKSKKGLIRFGHFKKVYEKSLNYIDLNCNLEIKENTTHKKVKI
jgi:hypothetical protein